MRILRLLFGPSSTLVGESCQMDHFRPISKLVMVLLARLVRERAKTIILGAVRPFFDGPDRSERQGGHLNMHRTGSMGAPSPRGKDCGRGRISQTTGGGRGPPGWPRDNGEDRNRRIRGPCPKIFLAGSSDLGHRPQTRGQVPSHTSQHDRYRGRSIANHRADTKAMGGPQPAHP